MVIYMAIPLNKKLYEKVKMMANNIYSKPSAYKSGFIVKKYKELGGKYKQDNNKKNLNRWFREQWVDVCEYLKGNIKKCGRDNKKEKYPYCRPLKRISKDTPKTINEIDKNKLIKACKLKKIDNKIFI